MLTSGSVSATVARCGAASREQLGAGDRSGSGYEAGVYESRELLHVCRIADDAALLGDRDVVCAEAVGGDVAAIIRRAAPYSGERFSADSGDSWTQGVRYRAVSPARQIVSWAMAALGGR